jgi:hypothetical protein
VRNHISTPSGTGRCLLTLLSLSNKWICFAHRICEFTPISTSKNTRSPIPNKLHQQSRYLPIIQVMSHKIFVLQCGHSSGVETISKMHSTARPLTGRQCRKLLQLQTKRQTMYCNKHNYNLLQSIVQHQVMQRPQLTSTTRLHLNAYDRWQHKVKPPANDIEDNTVTLHVQWTKESFFMLTKSGYRDQL